MLSAYQWRVESRFSMLGNTRCDLHPAGYPEVIRVGGLELPLASISPADTLQGEGSAVSMPISERSPEHRLGCSSVADRVSGHGVGRGKTIRISQPVSL